MKRIINIAPDGKWTFHPYIVFETCALSDCNYKHSQLYDTYEEAISRAIDVVNTQCKEKLTHPIKFRIRLSQDHIWEGYPSER